MQAMTTVAGGNIMEGVLASMASDAQVTQERLRALMTEQDRIREATTRLINELQATGAELARNLRAEQLIPVNRAAFRSEFAILSQKITQITGEIKAEQAKQTELAGLLATSRAQNDALREQEIYWRSQAGQAERVGMYLARYQAAKAVEDAAKRAQQEVDRLRLARHRIDSDGNNK